MGVRKTELIWQWQAVVTLVLSIFIRVENSWNSSELRSLRIGRESSSNSSCRRIRTSATQEGAPGWLPRYALLIHLCVPQSPAGTHWALRVPRVCLIWNTQGGGRQQGCWNSVRTKQEWFIWLRLGCLGLSKDRLILPLVSRTIQSPWEFF